MTHSLPIPANPGAAATATLFDHGVLPKASSGTMAVQKRARISLVLFANEVVTVFHKWGARGSSNLRTINGAGTGEASTANVLFVKDFLLLPGRNQITLVTTTGPTTWELDAEMTEDRVVGT
jgi:hypothetical protein